MIVNGETFRNYFIFSPVYSLIMWLMKHMKPQRKISSHTFKMPTFSKFFDDLMSLIIREYAGEKMK